jgi:hypothetical protein
MRRFDASPIIPHRDVSSSRQFMGVADFGHQKRYKGGGGFFKSVVKMVATAVGGSLGGPIGAFAANSLTGMALGEKPGQALTSGALAGLSAFGGQVIGGMSQGASLGDALGQASSNLTQPFTNLFEGVGGASNLMQTAGDTGVTGAIGADSLSSGALGQASAAAPIGPGDITWAASGAEGAAMPPLTQIASDVGAMPGTALAENAISGANAPIFGSVTNAIADPYTNAAGYSGIRSILPDGLNKAIDPIMNLSTPAKIALGGGALLALGGLGGGSKEGEQQVGAVSAPPRSPYDTMPLQTAQELKLTPSYQGYGQDFRTYGQRPEHEFVKYAAKGGRIRGGHLDMASQDLRRGGPARGPGSGQADAIPAMLSDGEYVVPADVVARLGNGSNSEGARRLDALRRNVRKDDGRSNKLPRPAMSPLAYMRG